MAEKTNESLHHSQPTSGVADQLLVKLQAAWQELAECTSEVYQASTDIQKAPDQSCSVEAIRAWYERTTRLLLKDSVQRFLRSQPTRQALEAMHACDQEIAPASARSRARLDARFQRLLTTTALDLCEPWRIWQGGDQASEWQAWRQRCERHSKEASATLDKYRRWSNRASARSNKMQPESKKAAIDAQWRQHRALIATLDTEVVACDMTLMWFEAVHVFANDLQHECEQLHAYTVSTLEQLQTDQPDIAAEPFNLVTPKVRIRAWALPMEIEANRRFPERAELLVAGHSPRIRSVPLRASFLKTFDRYARAPMNTIVEQSWHKGAASLREVVQAKEMIAYWSEASSNQQAQTVDALAEARHNAIANLTEQLQAPPYTDTLEIQVLQAFWTLHKKGSLAFEAELYGWISLLRRPRGRALPGTAIEAGRLKAQSTLQRAGSWTSARVDQLMESIGSRVPSHPTVPPVVRRTTLRDILALPAAISDLPAVYRLLFRITPVEDRRFLVGREHEFAGLQQALDDWTSGRFAACLLIGARGSGKTSLLNCALREVFAGQPCIRSQFHERILSPEKLDGFLRDLLHLSEDADLERAFQAERRVIILEEAERVYLRRVGGFTAAHYLALLIHRTAATTFWLLVMNDRSFRVLDAGAHLGRIFSHRINAMNVSRADLENAILERHRLSGMHLDFAPPPVGDAKINRVKRWIGLDDSAQKLFFDSLFQQSEGVFRSAFQLWLSSIERVEGQTIKIRQPLDPAFNRFRTELAQEDQLTLLVIQEHGSLTTEELSEVLCEDTGKTRGRIVRLAALGLIGPDPEHPGLRVHPEAQRFVNDLLRRANLT